MTTTSRQVTFMGITTTIDPIVDRKKLVKKAEAGFVTPTALHNGLRAHWNNMTDTEKEIEFEELNK